MRNIRGEIRESVRKLLTDIATEQIPEASLERLESTAYWERAYLLRARPALRRLALDKTPFLHRKEFKMLVEKLAVLRELALETNPGRWLRDQKDFQGNTEQLELLLDALGAPVTENEWNAWRKRFPKRRPDLRGADLSGLYLQNVRLDGARLDGAQLGGSQLRVCNLRRVSFVGARLSEADFTSADLRGADLREARLYGAVFADAELSGADLRGAVLTGCVLNRASLYSAKLDGALVWGTSVWDAKFDASTQQSGLRIGWEDLDPIDIEIDDSAAWQAPEKSLVVDDIRVAHFMSLVRENEHLAQVIDAASSKMVLLLGRFQGPQRQVLDKLKDALLLRFNYAPVVFDFREPVDRDLIETVACLAGLAKFIIADLTDPRSTPLESQLTIPQIAIPWAPIIRRGDRPFSMFASLQRKYEWVLPTVEYRNATELLDQLEDRIVRPAVALSRKLRRMKHPASDAD